MKMTIEDLINSHQIIERNDSIKPFFLNLENHQIGSSINDFKDLLKREQDHLLVNDELKKFIKKHDLSKFVKGKTLQVDEIMFCLMTSDVDKFIRENDDRYTFGQRIETIIERKNITKKDLVNESNVSGGSFDKAIRGTRLFPSEMILKLLIGLKCTKEDVEYIFNKNFESVFDMTQVKHRLIKYCIMENQYDKKEIDDWLINNGEKPLFEYN